MICLRFATGSGLIKMKKAILVINCGSSSVKVSLFLENDRIDESYSNETISIKEALTKIYSRLSLETYAIQAIGHRFVHGGSSFIQTTRITKKTTLELSKLLELAPLHNKDSLEGIEWAVDTFTENTLQVCVFDTAFHSTLPKHAASYALDKELAESLQIKRYGFHGISHKFLSDLYSKKIAPHKKIITMHLGAGCSICAIDKGVSKETSMGFTPAEGLVMATRAGDIDAAVLAHIVKEKKCSSDDALQILNYNSGLLGVSGISANMQTLTASKKPGAEEAIDLFCYRLLKYLGAYIFVLEGVDALIFSGGIGENAPLIRKKIIDKMKWYGLLLDETKNNQAINLNPADVEKISSEKSTIDIFVIATDENKAIQEEIDNRNYM